MAATLNNRRHDDLAVLFSEHRQTIYAYLRSRTSAHVAEEVTSTVFEEAAKRMLKSGDEISPQWLMTVAKRRLIDDWRKNGRSAAFHCQLENLESLLFDGRSQQDDFDNAQLVLELLDGVAPAHRRVLAYRYILDMTIGEVAEQLGVTYKAAESLIARARKRSHPPFAEERNGPMRTQVEMLGR